MKNSQELIDRQLSEIEQRATLKFSHCTEMLENDEAKRIYLRGFRFRFEMIVFARKWLYNKVNNQSTPISPSSFPEWGLYFNAYYLNVRGALDNLAWSLNYELDLGIADVMKVNLFGKDFIKIINEKQNELVKSISKFKNWYEDVKNIRDPAAHRVPLTFASGTIFGDNVQEYSDKMDKSRTLLSEVLKEKHDTLEELIGHYKKNEKILDESQRLYHEAQALEEYQPIVMRYDGSQVEYRTIIPLLFDDHKKFLELGNIVADFYLSITS